MASDVNIKSCCWLEMKYNAGQRVEGTMFLDHVIMASSQSSTWGDSLTSRNLFAKNWYLLLI